MEYVKETQKRPSDPAGTDGRSLPGDMELIHEGILKDA